MNTQTIEAPAKGNEVEMPSLIELSGKKSSKHPDFDAITYAAQVVSKDLTREAINCVCIHKGWVIGTNGRQLNMAKLKAFDPGQCEHLYKVVKLTKTVIVLSLVKENYLKYPDYEAVIPEANKDHLIGSHESDGENPSAAFCEIINDSEHRPGFNFDLFRKTAPKGKFTSYQENERTPLLLIGDGKTETVGILMPIRLS